MIIIKDDQKIILNKYVPDYEEYLNKDVDDLLDILDEVMLDSLIDEEVGPETSIISNLYDQIYMQN